MKTIKRIYAVCFRTTDEPPAPDAAPAPAPEPPAGGEPTPPAATPEPAPANDDLRGWINGLDGLTAEDKTRFAEMSKADLVTMLKGPQAPDAYTLPEGLSVDNMDKAVFDKFSELAKGLKMPQEMYEALLKFDAERMSTFAEDMRAYNQHVFADGIAKMRDELGTKKAEETIAAGQEAMRRFGDEKIAAFLDSTGLGNSPELIRLFANVGRAVTEGGLPGGSPPAPAAKLDMKHGNVDAAKNFYDKMNK